jgi:hypothetical protein
VAKKCVPSDHHILVLDRKGGVGDPEGKTYVCVNDVIHWHPKDGFFFVNIDFGASSPVKDKKPGTIVPGRVVKRVVIGPPGTYPYGTPGRATLLAGDPEIIVTGGIRQGGKKGGRKKAGKKR